MALSTLEAAEPKSVGLLRALAGVTLELQDLEGARRYQDRLQTLGDRHPALAFNLGVALGQAGRHEEAVQAYSEAVDQQSDFASAWLNLGHSLHKLGKHDQARDAWSRYQALAA